jgi:hypothetical protein
MLITQNVFSMPLLQDLHAYTRDGKQPSRTNFFAFPQDVVGFSNAIFCFDLPTDLKDRVAEELMVKSVFPTLPTKWTASLHLYSRASGVPWHDDRNHIYSGTVYLNPQWDHNWGGYFAYEDGNEIKCLKPTYNTGAFFKTPLLHSAMVTAGNAPFRESLQIFVDEF